jgi:hypothetical protein
MFGRRSLSLPIFSYDPNLERISKRSDPNGTHV